MSIGFTVD